MTRELPPRRWHLLLLAVGWTAFVAYGSLVPLQFRDVSLADALERFKNLPPPTFGVGTRADLGVNVLLFIPLTFLWMGAFTCDRGRIVRGAMAVLLVPAGALTAVTIEFSQLWFTRTPSQNDIVAESFGGVIGVLLWLGGGERFVAWWRTFATDRQPRSRLTWLLEAYLLGLLIYSVVPLDLTLSFTDLYHKYERGQVLIVPFRYPYSSVSTMVYQFFADIAEFVPAGTWVTLRYGHRLRDHSSLWIGAVGGGLIAGGIELLQLLVLSRYTDSTDVVLGTLGGAIGGWMVGRQVHNSLASSSGGRGRHRATAQWMLAIAIYSVFLAAGFWFPFDSTRDRVAILAKWQGFFRLPFTALYLGNEYNALTQMLIRVLLFAPLGAMWAFVASHARTRAGRQTVALAGVAYSAALAFGIEAAEIFMPSKVADSTEVMLCVIGGVAGVYLTLGVLRGIRQDDATQSPPPKRAV